MHLKSTINLLKKTDVTERFDRRFALLLVEWPAHLSEHFRRDKAIRETLAAVGADPEPHKDYVPAELTGSLHG